MHRGNDLRIFYSFITLTFYFLLQLTLYFMIFTSLQFPQQGNIIEKEKYSVLFSFSYFFLLDYWLVP